MPFGTLFLLLNEFANLFCNDCVFQFQKSFCPPDCDNRIACFSFFLQISKTFADCCFKENRATSRWNHFNFKRKCKHVDVLFDTYINLLKAVDGKINLVILVPMQIQPLQNCEMKEMADERINQINVKFKDYSNNRAKPHVTVLPIDDTMLNL